MKHIYTSIILFFVLQFSFGQIVNIPDANFKTALLSHDPVIDTNGDGEIQVSEAQSLTTTVEVVNKGINDLTGIEAFVNVIEINCYANNLTSVDFTSNVAVEIIKILHNDLTEIDLSQNPNLREFWCNFNEFETLDFSSNINLEFISAPYMNTFTHIDLSNNINLERVFLVKHN